MHISVWLKICVFVYVIRTSLEISQVAVEAAIQGIEIVNEWTKAIYETLANDNDITAGDVVIAYLQQIPVVGTIVNIITGGNGDEIQEKLDKMQNQLDEFSGQLKKMLTLTENLKLKIDFLTTNIIISNAASTINSCSKDRNTFLLGPKVKQAKDRLLRDACSQNIMDPIRQIVRILKEEKFTLDSQQLFQYMVKSDGSCDGQAIENTYKYLFGLVLDGCRTAIITEKILYNGTSKIMLNECKQEASYVSYHYESIFNRCLKYSCEGVQKGIKHTFSEVFDKPVKEQMKTLSNLFPWFKFVLAKFTADPDFKILGTQKISEIIFQKGEKHMICLWVSYASSWIPTCSGNPSQRFMAATFNSSLLEELSTGIKVTITPGSILSCMTKEGNVTYNACPKKSVRLQVNTSGSLSLHSEVIFIVFIFLLSTAMAI